MLRDPLMALAASSETRPRSEPPLSCSPAETESSRHQHLPCGSFPFSAFSSPQQHDMGRSCHTPNPLAPSGFLNLLTPSSAASLPALFHAGITHGVDCPSELCPFHAAVRCLQRLYPLVVTFELRHFESNQSGASVPKDQSSRDRPDR